VRSEQNVLFRELFRQCETSHPGTWGVYPASAQRYAGVTLWEGFDAKEKVRDRGSGVAPLLAQDAKASPEMPKVGDMAPDFTLHYFDGGSLKPVKLSDFLGKKNVVLAFYIFAFTGG